MHKTVMFLAATFALCARASAGEPAMPRVSSTNAGDRSIALAFSEPMLTWAGHGQPHGLSFDPPFDCDWHWDGDTRLICEAEAGRPALRPATRYRLAMTADLWSQQGVALPHQTLLLDSSRPTIDSAWVDWTDADRPSILIGANVRLGAKPLRDTLVVARDDGTDEPYALEPSPRRGEDATSTRSWRMRFPATNAGERRVVIRVRPGLHTDGGDLVGTQDQPIAQIHLDEPFVLRRAGCGQTTQRANAPLTLRCAAGSPVLLEFSTPPSRSALDEWRRTLPRGIALTAPATGGFQGSASTDFGSRPGYLVQVVADRADTAFSFDVPSSLHAEGGAKLARSLAFDLRTTDFPPRIDAIPAQLLLPVEADPGVEVRAMNQAGTTIRQTVLGDDLHFATQEQIHVAAPKNQLAVLKPPRVARDIRMHGGLVDGGVRLASSPAPNAPLYTQPLYAVAWAPFNLSLDLGDGHGLVWATRWSDAAPIAGAEVEVLARAFGTDEFHRIGVARTDADGVAIVDFPSGEPQPALVRATFAGKRTILPLLDTTVPIESASHRSLLLNRMHEGARIAWGITDRPLYRAGERVNYRLWIRQRAANRLVAVAHDARGHFRLTGPSEPGVEFDADIDDWGSAGGELELPSTLRDGDYCISPSPRPGQYDPDGGACFRVTSSHVRDTWTELSVDRALALAGERIELTTRAGYFSGGPLVGAGTTIQSLLTPERIEDAYPRYRDYRFIDPYASLGDVDSEGFEETTPTDLLTDDDGAARASILLDNPGEQARLAEHEAKPIPFGKLEFSAYATPSSQEAGASATTSLHLSRYARFVGLRQDEWLLHKDADPRVEAIVIGADGTPVDEARVHVRIDAVTRNQASAKDASGSANTGAPLATCELRSGKASTCAFRPPHAGTYRLTASSDGAAPTSIERHASGESAPIADDTGAATASLALEAGDTAGMHLVLTQPFAKARVLFMVEHGRVLAHWTTSADGPVTHIEQPIAADWAPGVTIKALVLDAQADPFGVPARAIMAAASIDVPIARLAHPPGIELVSDHAQARPGEEIVLTLRNRADAARRVTLAVVDDAVRALAPELVAQADPRGETWLGLLATWRNADLHALATWNRDRDHAAMYPRWFTVFDSSSSQRLDTITVTGSNIRRVDIFTRQTSRDHSLGQPQAGHTGEAAALRSDFAATAYWNGALVLTAGASTDIRVRLPDNLTRWRVLAWANDAGDTFELATTTIDAQLPIEVRVDVPARVFTGDATTLAASVRNHAPAPADVRALFRANGPRVDAGTQWRSRLAANADRRIAVGVEATAPGRIDVDARADTPGGGEDGVSASVDVAPTLVREKTPVAGWLPAEGVDLHLPGIPAGARNVQLRIEASRGVLSNAAGWVDALRDYPHRCWEQTLSRAVAATASRRLGLSARWPEADASIDDAIAASTRFQDESGLFHFFVGDRGEMTTAPSLYLTAYSVRAFEFLAAQGHAVPADVLSRARGALAEALARSTAEGERFDANELAAAAATLKPSAQAPGLQAVIDRLWSSRAGIGWSARADLARARAERGSDDGIRELRDAAPLQAGRRRIAPFVSNWIFETEALGQCKLIGALAAFDRADDARARQRDYLRGLADLYTGGPAQLDTQSMAQCLMALAEQPDSASHEPLHVDAMLGATRAGLDVAAGDVVASTKLAIPAGASAPLRLDASGDAPLASFVATLEYDIDGRKAQRSAVGFGLDRRYDVLRGHAWKEVAADAIREGDWVRVTLRLSTNALRRYVAVTDVVPGGLRPTDLQLAGVAGLDLRNAADEGSAWFSARRVDERNARFYAETLPPGSHEIHYYARATHAGHYAALPAVAELMYGTASRAQTAAAAITVGRATPAR